MSGEGATTAASATWPRPGPPCSVRPSVAVHRKFPMLEQIREIESGGRTVRIDILRYGMSPTEASTVEAAVHDALGLPAEVEAREPTPAGRRPQPALAKPAKFKPAHQVVLLRIGGTGSDWAYAVGPPRLAHRPALDRPRLDAGAAVGGHGGGRPGGRRLPDPAMGARPGHGRPDRAGPGRRSGPASGTPSSDGPIPSWRNAIGEECVRLAGGFASSPVTYVGCGPHGGPTPPTTSLGAAEHAPGTRTRTAGPVASHPMDHPMTQRLEELAERRALARNAGSPRAVEKHHAKGKMTARERIDYLLDDGSFQELDMLARHRAHGMGLEENRPYTDGVITGFGTIEGRRVCVFSQDFTVFGGALGEVFAEKIHKVMDLATSIGVPMIGLNDGAGARIQEGVVSLHSYGGIFHRNAEASGVIPQISVILGPCAGGAVYSPAMTDFIFMVQGTSHMFITGPDVVKTVTGEDVTLEELGGAMSHATKSGVAAFVAPDEKSCLDDVRYLLSFLPSNNLEEAPHGGLRGRSRTAGTPSWST